MTKCNGCSVEMEKYSWSKRHGKMIEHSLCLPCWKKANPRKEKRKPASDGSDDTHTDETNALLIGSLELPTHANVIVSSLEAPHKLNATPQPPSITENLETIVHTNVAPLTTLKTIPSAQHVLNLNIYW